MIELERNNISILIIIQTLEVQGKASSSNTECLLVVKYHKCSCWWHCLNPWHNFSWMKQNIQQGEMKNIIVRKTKPTSKDAGGRKKPRKNLKDIPYINP